MLATDTVLQGRYRIVRQLGQGGMGAVYEAIDERLDTTVALKETLFTDEKLRKQFEREARLLARMPDGTRIITGPKGRVQVIPPGDRPNRRRERPGKPLA